MTVALNHTIVAARDAEESAAFLSEIMGRPRPSIYHFVMVETANGVSLDFATVPDGDDVVTFTRLVSEDEFDAIFGRILERGLDHWADPAGTSRAGSTTTTTGRGVYFPDPSGHLLEIITPPTAAADRSRRRRSGGGSPGRGARSRDGAGAAPGAEGVRCGGEHRRGHPSPE